MYFTTLHNSQLLTAYIGFHAARNKHTNGTNDTTHFALTTNFYTPFGAHLPFNMAIDMQGSSDGELAGNVIARGDYGDAVFMLLIRCGLLAICFSKDGHGIMLPVFVTRRSNWSSCQFMNKAGLRALVI